MLQTAESFIHLTFSTTVYYFHQNFEWLSDFSYFHGHSESGNRLDYGKKDVINPALIQILSELKS